MKYRGLIDTACTMTFTQAIVAGVDAREGYFVPVDIAPLPRPFFNYISEMASRDVAFVVLNSLVGNDYSAEKIRAIVDEWVVDDIQMKQAGDRTFALEPVYGSTMSQYDLIGRLFAILLRDLFDRGIVSLDTVFFSPAFYDSASAISSAFSSLIGKSLPVIFQSMGVLTDIEKRQLADVVPREMLYKIPCDQNSLLRLCVRLKAFLLAQHSAEKVLVSDINVVAVIARVFMFFEAYRQVKRGGVDDNIVICIDGSNEGDLLAARLAVKLGLPVKTVVSQSTDDVTHTIVEAYNKCSYILTPRSASCWQTLNDILGRGETGVFIQPSHQAKFSSLLEPLLGRVIRIPHKLYYEDNTHVRYKHIAPSVQALKNCV